eukprot:scaffold10.g2332.t1
MWLAQAASKAEQLLHAVDGAAAKTAKVVKAKSLPGSSAGARTLHAASPAAAPDAAAPSSGSELPLAGAGGQGGPSIPTGAQQVAALAEAAAAEELPAGSTRDAQTSEATADGAAGQAAPMQDPAPALPDGGGTREPDAANGGDASVPPLPASPPLPLSAAASSDVAAAIAAAAAAAAAAEAASAAEEVAAAEAAAAADASAADSAQREARLRQVIQQLKARLETVRAENLQLEEMLAAADAQARGGSSEVSRLEDQLERANADKIKAEAALQHMLAGKESEVAAVREQLTAAGLRASSLEAQLAAERRESEGQLVAALRREAEGVEAALDAERTAHAATRRAAAAREQELSSGVAETAAALAALQRALDDRSAALSAAEERGVAAEAEVEALSRQLAAAEEAAAAARAEAQVAATGRAAAEEEAVRLRADAAALRRQLQEAQSVDAGELQARLKEASDMLFLKQSQLERMAADKAGAVLALERELAAARQEAQAVRRRGAMEQSLSAEEDVVPLSHLGDTYQRLANSRRVGSAVQAGARVLDSTTAQARSIPAFVRVLKRHPLGRLLVFAYLLALHLMVYGLLHRLQACASGRVSSHKAFEAAEALGAEQALLAAAAGAAGDALGAAAGHVHVLPGGGGNALTGAAARDDRI